MKTQKIRLLCHITLEVPIELSKEELVKRFNSADVSIYANLIPDTNNLLIGAEELNSIIDIVDIEEEGELYKNE